MALSPGMRAPPGLHSDGQAGSTERWRHLLFNMAPQCPLRGRQTPDSGPGSARAADAAGRGGLQRPARRPRDSPGRGSAGTGRPLRLLLVAPRAATRSGSWAPGPRGLREGGHLLRCLSAPSSPAPSKAGLEGALGQHRTVGTLHWQHSELCR
jgi:hypothetical protein